MEKRSAIHWFRKGLRLHDNPALIDACRSAATETVYPCFCIDPYFAKPDVVGVNRYSFLLQSLQNLDDNLRKAGSRLYVIRGSPEKELPAFAMKHNVGLVTFEADTEPYAIQRDASVREVLQESGVEVRSHASHTLHDMERYVAASKGMIPNTYQAFLKLFHKMGDVRDEAAALCIDATTTTSTSGNSSSSSSSSSGSSGGGEECIKSAEGAVYIPCGKGPKYAQLLADAAFDVPSLEEVGYGAETPTTPFLGGETEALDRLARTVTHKSRHAWVAQFEKPKTKPNSLEPDTTVLSPYLKFGCLSPVRFYHALAAIYAAAPKHAQPPVSLHGQLMWREFFYLNSFTTPNFDKMEGSKQIPWERDAQTICAWKEGRTGYPFIDAIMTQLRVEGWIHHLARHAVACFLTRGDLWQHWEEGARVFDLYLLDADWALNNANWQWLSASCFFYQYYRVYSPVAFGKKTDPNGDYIRKWIPELKKYPKEYIYEPWKAPLSMQRACGCLIDAPNSNQTSRGSGGSMDGFVTKLHHAATPAGNAPLTTAAGAGAGGGSLACYPHPIAFPHEDVSKENIARMKTAYANQPEQAPKSTSSSSGTGKDAAKKANEKKRKLTLETKDGTGDPMKTAKK